MRICSIQKIPQKAKLAKPVYDHKGILLLKDVYSYKRKLLKSEILVDVKQHQRC